MNEQQPETTSPWPQRQVYYVSVEWLDQPHQPESPERIAMVLRNMLEHAHNVPPETPAARFTVRVRGEEVTSEVSGTVVHHHHHQHHEEPQD